MTNESVVQENIYTSSDIAAILGVQESTIRKYCGMLEKAGYKFYKNGLNHRGFFDKDVIALRKLISIKNHPDMTLEQACNAVMAWIRDKDVAMAEIAVTTSENSNSTPVNYELLYTELIKEFVNFKEQQETFNSELIQELKKQNEYIKNQNEYINKSLEERDNKLTAALKESLAVRQLEHKKENNKKWYKFWKS